jgi:hypothetical protein
MAPLLVIAVSPLSSGNNITLYLAQTGSFDIFTNITRLVHAHSQNSFLHIMVIIAAIIGLLVFGIAFFVLWKWTWKWWEQRVAYNKCFETQQQLGCLGLRAHNWSDYANNVPTLPPIEWYQVMESSQNLVGGFLHGNPIELDGGVTVMLDGDVVRMVNQDREEDWETESEDDEQDSHSEVVSIIGPLCIADVADHWGTEPSEVEGDKLAGPEGDVVTTMKTEKDWQTNSEEDELEVPARAYLGYRSYI